ncbi:MAG: hypothetical protein AYK19_04700 [Theionarchaea archaeon DG-70-1]|nr:MAG: hypothetical protein AYK19_04700 [Theionarchaea archaeon DG-70-1]
MKEIQHSIQDGWSHNTASFLPDKAKDKPQNEGLKPLTSTYAIPECVKNSVISVMQYLQTHCSVDNKKGI